MSDESRARGHQEILHAGLRGRNRRCNLVDSRAYVTASDQGLPGSPSAENTISLGDRAQNMIKRRRRNRGNQAVVAAIELVKTATPDRMTKIMPVQPIERFASPG